MSADLAAEAAAAAARRTTGRKVGTIVLGTVLGIAALAYAMHGIDRHDLRQMLRDARPAWIALAGGILGVSYCVRSQRWAWILGVRRNFASLLWATGMGYALNSLLPARAGDLARSVAGAVAIKRPTALVLASTVVERVLDAVFLVVAILIALPSAPNTPDWIVSGARGAAVVCAIALAVIGVAVLRHRRRDDDRLHAGGIRGAGPSFMAGLALVNTTRTAARAVGITILIWSSDVLLIMALSRGFGIDLSPMQSMLLICALGLASAAPSTPGFVGVYQAICVALLVPLGATQASAVGLATALQIVTLLVAGVITLLGSVLRTTFTTPSGNPTT